MKKLKVIYFLIIVSFVFLSCSETQVQWHHNDWKPEDLPAGTAHSDTLYFSLSSPQAYMVPVIKLMIAGKEHFFLVDSGAAYNFFSSEELLNSFVNEYSGSMKNKVRYHSQLDTDGHHLCGILGLPFLSDFHKNATLDYKNQTLTFDTPAISETGIVPEKLWNGVWILPFQEKRVLEYYIVDTGASIMIRRPEYGRSNDYPTFKQKYDYIQENDELPLESTGYQTINTFTLDKKRFKNLSYLMGNSDLLRCSLGTRRLYHVYNGLGGTVFQDHIIQFDFENNVFRIN